jgi:F-type H+-transporting ATPase subunit b
VLIDWFTVVAQIINFLVLAYLLKRFLYGPIVTAMRAREQQIMTRIQEADQRRAVADQVVQDYQRQQMAFEQQREALLADARHDADARREALIRAARADVAALKATWQAAVERDEAAFLRMLRRRAGTQVVDVARRVLGDLADADLEQRIITVFLERLRHLDPEERTALEHTVAQAPPEAVVRCAFPLAAAQRQQIGHGLHDLLGTDLDLASETAPDLICGISLVVGGREIAWSIQSYLETLEDQVAQALTAAITPAEGEAVPAPAAADPAADNAKHRSVTP